MKTHPSLTKTLVCASGVISLITSNSLAQTPVDASDGIDFGNGADDPYIGKALTNEDLEIRLGLNSALKLFNGTNTQPSFIAAQGHEASVPSAGWYRIAQSSSAKRANAKFTLNDNISGGGHSTAVFYAGISHGDESKMSVTLLSHNRYDLLTFSKVRIVENATDDHFYLEVKVDRPGAVRFAISENLSNDGWKEIDWTPSPTIPTNYTAREYDIDKLFMVGDSQSRFSIDRGGKTTSQGLPVLLNKASSGYYATALGNSSTVASGQYSLASGYSTTASGTGSFASGGYATASGSLSSAFGYYSLASGDESFAVADGTASGVRSFAAIGGNATGFGSLAMANGSAHGSESISIGSYSQAYGQSSVAIGVGSLADSEMSTALAGGNAYAYRSVAIGINAPRYTPAGQTAWQGDNLNSSFEVGIGDLGDRKNALTVLQDGSVEIGHNSTDATIPLHIKADGSVILSKPQGDILMGDYGQP